MKKTLTLLAAMAFCCSAGFAQSEIIMGDMNGDGKLTVEDITSLVETVVGNKEQRVVPLSHEYVDLGLPSGTLWATCNVGAICPEDYGDLFAWGETKPKSTYNWATYFDSVDGSDTNFSKYNISGGLTELELVDDAAYRNWGEGWCMPTVAQAEELKENCTWTMTTRNGTNGYLVESKKNGHSIFFPFAGMKTDDEKRNMGSYGYYRTRMLSTSNSMYAQYFQLNKNGLTSASYLRCNGYSVRPVRSK